MIWNVPNILTVLRLLAAPAVAVMFLYFTRPYADWFALILFVTAAVTDWFDGYLARTWKQETKLGAMLDPIADKAMVVIALMILVGYSIQAGRPGLCCPPHLFSSAKSLFRGCANFSVIRLAPLK
jgi:CDP-diacylglycerol--glycerol-3-phosphate 3-phosphatidyltransferase